MNYGAPTQLPFGDEGRAMLQIVHDVAPGASLAFYTAVNSEADFANGIGKLAASVASGGAGAKVIADDVGYFDEPFFQDGIVAQAIDAVEAQGVAYFSPPRATTERWRTTIHHAQFQHTVHQRSRLRREAFELRCNRRDDGDRLAGDHRRIGTGRICRHRRRVGPALRHGGAQQRVGRLVRSTCASPALPVPMWSNNTTPTQVPRRTVRRPWQCDGLGFLPGYDCRQSCGTLGGNTAAENSEHRGRAGQRHASLDASKWQSRITGPAARSMLFPTSGAGATL